MKTFIIKTAIIIILLQCMTGCQKNSPATLDSIKPKLQLTLTGGGLNKTFYSDSSYTYGQLNLKPNTKYNFTITASDTGGLKLLQFYMSSEHNFGTINSTPAHTNIVSGIQRVFTINNNNPSDPYTSFILYGDFTTFNVGASEDVAEYPELLTRDYNNNTAGISLQSLISQSPPFGYGWVKL